MLYDLPASEDYLLVPWRPDFPYVLVAWRDVMGAGQDWTPLPQKEPAPLYCLASGWLVVDGLERIEVIPHMTVPYHGDDPPTGCGNMVIERAMIVWIKEVELP